MSCSGVDRQGRLGAERTASDFHRFAAVAATDEPVLGDPHVHEGESAVGAGDGGDGHGHGGLTFLRGVLRVEGTPLRAEGRYIEGSEIPAARRSGQPRSVTVVLGWRAAVEAFTNLPVMALR